MMPGFLYSDALGNQAAKIRELLRQWGYESQVYAQFRDPRLKDPGEDYTRYRGGPDDVLIFHYSIASPLTQFALDVPSTLVVYYHNVTPPKFLRNHNPELADLLARGRSQLSSMKDAPLSIAASEYNRQEMMAVGFQNVNVIPYFVYLDELKASAASREGQAVMRSMDDGYVNWLFVGRIVPNKCQDNIIDAFNYYHSVVNRHSRLFLVGSEANAPGYRMDLEIMIEALGLSDAVHLTGSIGLNEGLGGYYQGASLFISMSEHEGFCVPLLEAMAFNKPVVAYNATGIPYTLGDSGVLINHKHYGVIGELVDLIMKDHRLYQRIVDKQRARLLEFKPERVAAQLRAYIESTVA
jgi:glycosyltransferase involved in cell wall biosynthesis